MVEQFAAARDLAAIEHSFLFENTATPSESSTPNCTVAKGKTMAVVKTVVAATMV